MRDPVTIRPVSHPRYSYRVTYPETQPNGSRVRRASFFITKKEARGFADEKRVALGNFGVKHSDVADEERQAVIHFRQWAATRTDSPTLLDAVRDAILRMESTKPRLTVSKAIAERLAQAERSGCSRRHLDDSRQRLEKFETVFGNHQLSAITTKEIEGWLYGLKLSALSFANYRRVVHAVFAHAVRSGVLDANPCASVNAPKVRKAPPGILTAKELASLLAAASDEIRAAVAIQAFAGLRRAEVERLDWQDVQLDEGHIIVGASVAKTAGRRVVPITEALGAWLVPLAQPAGKLTPTAQVYQNRLETARTDAGIKRWLPNCLRHSAASYWLAKEQDIARVSLWLGHAPAVLQSNYRALVTPAAAVEWFAVLPGVPPTVVPFASKKKAS